MNHYLIYDASCSTCTQLATTVESMVEDRLEILNIHSKEASNLLNKVYPEGWRHAPYLIYHASDRIRAWTGIHAALRLSLLLGPRAAWKVWNLSKTKGKVFPWRSSAESQIFTGRRRLLKTGFLAGTLAVLAQFLRSPFASTSWAQTGNCPCHPCTGECYITGGSVDCGCRSECSNSCWPGVCEVDWITTTTCYCDECGSYYNCITIQCNDCTCA